MKKYSSMQVTKLKEELRRRGATTRGKKSDLVERLEQYDRNFNFMTPQLSQISDPVIILPPDDSYHDINSNTILPPIEKEHIRYYFERFNKSLKPSEKLYESRFLLIARSAVSNGFYYIRGYVKKTMKKLQYQVDVKLDGSGSIEECHCECPAGAGTEAHCKHVGVLLLAIHHVYSDKIILTAESQTQLLQSFHKPKKAYGGTPIKAQNLPGKKNKSIIFRPYPIETIDKRNYNNRFRYLILNSKSTMPLKQLNEPANPIALHLDHDYLKLSQEDQLLQNLKLSTISPEEIREIEQSTHQQSDCEIWHMHRSYRLTASNFHSICHLRPQSQAAFARQLIDRKPLTSRATTHGKINEQHALKKYSEEYGLFPVSCGLFISQENPYLAATPDALLGEETVIEIKCPYSSRNSMITPLTVSYLIIENGELKIKKTCPYYYQVQGQNVLYKKKIL